MAEDRRILASLTTRADGSFDVVIATDRAFDRVDVSCEGAVAPGSRVETRHVSRGRAVLAMIVGLTMQGGSVNWTRLARTVSDVLAVATGQGIRRAAALLTARYSAVLQASGVPGAVCSSGYLRPGVWPIGLRMQLQPIKDLAAAPELEQPPVWETTGGDPGFLLADHGMPMPMAAGWYRLRAFVEGVNCSLHAPALYPDFGNGYTHEEMIRLPDPDDHWAIDVLVLLKWDAKSLRFDPTIRHASFRILSFSVERLGRTAALLYMLRNVSGPDGRNWPETFRAAIGFARTVLGHGVSAATSDLFARQPYRHAVVHGNYAEWLRRYDTIGKGELQRFKRRAEELACGPLISLILPTYQTSEIWLRRCLDSVIGQTYRNWELCIADDASPDPGIRRVLEEYATADPRIKLRFREVNGHISEASNTALEMATGEFLGLLDHDDELRPHALLEVVDAILSRPGVGLIYSDEDKIDAEGRRFSPNFKPDWNPDLLLSQNYVCHFTVIRSDLVRKVGGFRVGFEGSQDHDLILRCTELLAPEQIHHVPKILYHWRAVAGSTALVREAKDYASAAGRRAVVDHLARTGREASVEELPHGHFRLRWAVPNPAPRVDIIIPTRDRSELLRTCVESIKRLTDYPNYAITVVDNQSQEPRTLEYLGDLARSGIRVLSFDAPFNYSAINNWAASQCDGELLCLLNNDIEVVMPDWLTEMAGQALRPEIGAVGAMLYYPDQTIQHAGVILGIGGVANHAYTCLPAGYPGHGARALVAQNLSAVTGACLVVRRGIYERAGGLDEQLQVAFNDIDFCLRLIQMGYRNLWTPFAELIHHESASRGVDDTPEKRHRFEQEVDLMRRRWQAILQLDPAYNPNLTLQHTDFALSFPPRC